MIPGWREKIRINIFFIDIYKKRTRFVAVIKVCSKYLNIDIKSMIMTTIYH